MEIIDLPRPTWKEKKKSKFFLLRAHYENPSSIKPHRPCTLHTTCLFNILLQNCRRAIISKSLQLLSRFFNTCIMQSRGYFYSQTACCYYYNTIISLLLLLLYWTNTAVGFGRNSKKKHRAFLTENSPQTSFDKNETSGIINRTSAWVCDTRSVPGCCM